MSWKGIVVMQIRGDSYLDQGGPVVEVVKGGQCIYIFLKVVLVGFINAWNVERERKRGVKHDPNIWPE